MKLKALAFALLLAGFGSSYALAKGKPPHHGRTTATTTSTTATGTTATTTTTTTTTTTSHGKRQVKLAVCHKAGKSGRWVKISVATKATQKAHLKHGDVLPDASGKCPANTPKTHTTTETTTTTQTTTDTNG
jgi:hypothetical protein